MVIFDPGDLAEGERKFVEKKQFKKPPSKDFRRFLKWQEECNVIYNSDYQLGEEVRSRAKFEMVDDDDIAIAGTEITRSDFCSLVNWTIGADEMTTDRESIANEYLRMIVEHVNKERIEDKETEAALEAAKHAEDQIQSLKIQASKRPNGRPRSRSRSPDTGRLRPVRDRRRQVPKRDNSERSVDQSSCKMIRVERFAKIRVANKYNYPTNILIPDLAGELTRMLQEINCTPTDFRTLDYLFIPIHDMNSHMILMGLAPKQKFAFVVDSYMAASSRIPTSNPETSWYRRGLQALLMVLDPAVKFTKDNVPVHAADKDRAWYIFGQYVLRSKKTDKSPNAVQQKDSYNCRIYTMTNAFCLAFGYNLECYTEKRLDKWKKARIAFELLQKKFQGAYEYDMIALPEQEIKIEGEEEGGEESAEPDSGSDLDMQYGFDENSSESGSLDSGYQTGKESEGSDGEVEDKTDKTAGRAFFTAREALLLERPCVQPLPDRLPWPSQFGKKNFQRAGFIYAAPSVNFQPHLKYSKRELKKACRNFPLTGWRRWSKQSQPLFLEWMLNEMAATLSMLRGDPVPPANNLLTAYRPKEDPKTGNKRKRSHLDEDSERQEGSKKSRVHHKPRR